jgi:hypothetical protein
MSKEAGKEVKVSVESLFCGLSTYANKKNINKEDIVEIMKSPFDDKFV